MSTVEKAHAPEMQFPITAPRPSAPKAQPAPAPAPAPEPAQKKRSYQPNPVVIERPPKCPRCGSIKRTIVRTRKLPHTPLDVDGKMYPGRIARNVVCDSCHLRYFVNVPREAEEAAPDPPRPCFLCRKEYAPAYLALAGSIGEICKACAKLKTSKKWLSLINAREEVKE